MDPDPKPWFFPCRCTVDRYTSIRELIAWKEELNTNILGLGGTTIFHINDVLYKMRFIEKQLIFLYCTFIGSIKNNGLSVFRIFC